MFNKRVRVAGIYIENDSILLVKHKKENKEYYLLPGGAQEDFETLENALKREWLEELSLEISIGELAFIGESIPPVNSKKNHILQVVFQINSIDGSIKVNPDGILYDYEWVPVKKIKDILLFPDCYNQIENKISNKSADMYQKYNWLD